jgi:hypothetical protein
LKVPQGSRKIPESLASFGIFYERFGRVGKVTPERHHGPWAAWAPPGRLAKEEGVHKESDFLPKSVEEGGVLLDYDSIPKSASHPFIRGGGTTRGAARPLQTLAASDHLHRTIVTLAANHHHHCRASTLLLHGSVSGSL